MLTIGLVGPCTSGKSTVGELLEKRGFNVRHIAQEHSFAKTMWKVISNPDVLVFLSVSYPITLKRRNWKWTEDDYREQMRRLSHAREHADIVIDTDHLSPDEIVHLILSKLG